MKKSKIISAVCLAVTLSLSCATVRQNYPAPSSSESAAFAYTMNFKSNAIFGVGFSSPLSALWAIRLKDDSIISEEIFVSENIDGTTAYFFNMKPGKYALLGVTYKKIISGSAGRKDGSIYVPDIEMISIALLTEIDMKKTVVDVKPGSMQFGGVVSINAGGELADDTQEHYQSVIFNKGDAGNAYPGLASVSQAKGSEVVGIIKSKAARKDFFERTRKILIGSGWEHFVKNDSAALQPGFTEK